jgi:hypothetical protein
LNCQPVPSSPKSSLKPCARAYRADPCPASLPAACAGVNSALQRKADGSRDDVASPPAKDLHHKTCRVQPAAIVDDPVAATPSTAAKIAAPPQSPRRRSSELHSRGHLKSKTLRRRPGRPSRVFRRITSIDRAVPAATVCGRWGVLKRPHESSLIRRLKN